MEIKRMHRVMGFVGVGLLLTACGGGAGGSSSEADGTLKLGMIDSLTGTVASAGQSNACGAKVAEELLSAGGVSDAAKVHLELADDESTPAKAAEEASVMTGEGVTLFVGGSTSTSVLAMMPIIEDSQGLSTGGTSKADEFLTAGTNVVRLNSTASQDSASVGGYIHGEGYGTVVIVASQDAFGEGAANALEGEMSDLDHEKLFVATGATDFNSTVTQVRKINPDAVVFVFGDPTSQVAFIKAIGDSGFGGAVVGYPGNLTSGTVAQTGGRAEGFATTDIYAPGDDNAANKTLVDAFEKYSGDISECGDKVLDRQVALTYSQVLLVALASDKAGSDDAATIRQTILDNEWSLPQGDVTFQKTGQANGTYKTLQVQGTNLVPVQ